MLPLRLLIHDRSCPGTGLRPGLSDAWRAGGSLYRGLGRLDATCGVASWEEALTWLVEQAARSGGTIGEVQFWGHGRRGCALIGDESLDASSLQSGARHAPLLRALRTVLHAKCTLWFRTCETLGGATGQHFARTLADASGARVAGHTYVIGFWQSGLHALAPGASPHWSVDEGVGARGPAATALLSSPALPNTIHCLQGTIPAGW